MAEKQPILRLTLIYNAGSGALNALAESARKLFGASECPLCDITHGLAGEKRGWRECQSTLGVPIETLHRDDLSEELEELVDGLPCVVAETAGSPLVLLGPQELKRCRGSVENFRGRLLTHAAMHDLEIPEAC